MRTLCLWLFLLPAAASLAAPAARERRIVPSGEFEHCVTLAQVRSTRVLDDRSVLFRMTDRRYYRNTLEENCPGLRMSGAFTYKLTGHRLCDSDQISVLEEGRSGTTCALGQFERVTLRWGTQDGKF